MDVGIRATSVAAQRPVAPSRAADKQALVEDQREVRALATRDREVRAHEAAHAAVGGAHAGSPSFQFTAGPNGQRYATSGHVNIDISPVQGDPEATLAKMQTIARAALAPAEPSAADRAVASQANAQAAQARAEIANQAQHALAGSAHGADLTGAAEPPPTPGSLIDVIV